MNVRCKVGIHKWIWNSEIRKAGGFLSSVYPIRKCSRCDKKQHGEYDMMYGTTIWIDGWPQDKVGIVNTVGEKEDRQCQYCSHGNHALSNYPQKVLCMVKGWNEGTHVAFTHSCDEFISEEDARKTIDALLDEIESDEIIGSNN